MTQPALVSAFIVKEDERAVNRVRSICAKYLHKVAHSGERRGMKPKKEEGRICKVSVYAAHEDGGTKNTLSIDINPTSMI